MSSSRMTKPKPPMVSFPSALGHGKVGKLLTYFNILEHLCKIKEFTLPGKGQSKGNRKRVEPTIEFESEESEDSWESSH